jgi:hypothetical protein
MLTGIAKWAAEAASAQANCGRAQAKAEAIGVAVGRGTGLGIGEEGKVGNFITIFHCRKIPRDLLR